MRAVRFDNFGIENLTIEEVTDPTPKSGEVLIAVSACTINPADAAVVSGAAAAGFPPTFKAPFTPGWDLAGHVTAVGEGVDGALVGKRVVGFSLWFDDAHGTQASLVVLPVDNIAVALDTLSDAELTTIGLNGLTAWRCVDEAALTSDDVLVVTGAAGSVGGFVTELAVSRGVRVIGVASERDREVLISYGVSDVVTKEQGDLGSAIRSILPGGADVLIDTASLAGPTLAAVKDGGRYVTPTVVPDSEREIAISRIYGVADPPALATLVELASSGQLHTPVAKTFDVAEVQAAYTEFGARSHYGRIVLTF